MEPRPAATVVVARDGASGLEVLLLQRTHTAVFMPGVFVFPGGAVDDADQDTGRWAGSVPNDDAEASRMLGVARGGLAYLIAAVRECFEEAGVLLADHRDGVAVGGDNTLDLVVLREQVCNGELELAELCQAHGLRLHTDQMGYLAHWVTPPGPPRRYDTRFFVAEAPPAQDAAHDGSETIDHVWINPAEALRLNRGGQFPLGSPTIRTLRTLAEFRNVGEALAHGRQGPARAPTAPVSADGRDGRRLIHPGEPAYAEIAKLHREGVSAPAYELIPGVVTRLSPRIRRVVAPNPGVMTGPGTNTYIVGTADACAVIDPGPDIEAHVGEIEAAAGTIGWILTTHTHRDHSPASRALRARTGARVLGMPAPHHGGQDTGYHPDYVPTHGERLSIDPETTLRVIHTPGHASNHLCFLLEEENVLFSGDHVMQGSTVVINPPDGDMGAYLQSLEALCHEDLAFIAPGHGFLMGDPHRVIDRIVSHRLAREAKVAQCLQRLGGADERTLVGCVYDDVPETMHGVAGRSLLAHLIKLQDEGAATQRGGVWYPGG
ncbi:MBL fold metallo-hydrolase [Ectothiorhodospiraceae bacterium WFHF3C12]|nr:MBL fold metallo-hydrolase [Ectothiorhodospiraceae bacterium WFHF3C12]